MAYTMKKKDDWRECGTVLNKKCKKGTEDYKWGIRFY